MANVITQIEMMKFAGMKTAEFPDGTIVTPSARDWAAEHNIEIVTGGSCESRKSSAAIKESDTGKAELLRQTIEAVINNMDKAGGILTRDEMVRTVTACLERMGCKVGEV